MDEYNSGINLSQQESNFTLSCPTVAFYWLPDQVSPVDPLPPTLVGYQEKERSLEEDCQCRSFALNKDMCYQRDVSPPAPQQCVTQSPHILIR